MISSSITVTTTAQRIVTKSVSDRTIYLHVVGNQTVYIGDSTVTSATGVPTEKHTAPIGILVPAGDELWVVVAAETADLRMLISQAKSGNV